MNRLRQMRVAATRPKAHGFTLIELLVVVSIVAILAGLMLPVLSRAKATAKRIACANKLRQWGLAFTMYLHDNDGFLPREAFGTSARLNNWAQVSDPTAADVWYNALPKLLKLRAAADYLNERAAFYGHDSLFHCPAARFPADAQALGNVLFSIAMNSKLKSGAAPVRASSILRPAQTVGFLENRLPGEPKVDSAQTDSDLGQPASFASRFVARHLNAGNLVFIDGHVESLHGNRVVETNRDSPNRGKAIVPQNRVIWTPDPAANPN